MYINPLTWSLLFQSKSLESPGEFPLGTGRLLFLLAFFEVHGLVLVRVKRQFEPSSIKFSLKSPTVGGKLRAVDRQIRLGWN
jgi:hypothetical protein